MKPPRDKISEQNKQTVSKPGAAARSGRRQQAPVRGSGVMADGEQSSLFTENTEESLEQPGTTVTERSTSETPATEDDLEFHFGSRAETNAALEEKIATQNTLKLHERI